jgi:hypothetical protein
MDRVPYAHEASVVTTFAMNHLGLEGHRAQYLALDISNTLTVYSTYTTASSTEQYQGQGNSFPPLTPYNVSAPESDKEDSQHKILATSSTSNFLVQPPAICQLCSRR